MQVTVVCTALETGPGVTSIEFRNSSAPVGTTQVDVTFRIISAGRSVTIQCSGQSQGNNVRQFTFSGSKGNNGSLHVTKSPTLHVCPDVVLLHKYLLKSTFQVQFSERIRDIPVAIKCSAVEPVGGPSVLQLRFTETRVPVDAVTAQVPYEIVSVGSPVQVICRAQSSNVTTSAAHQITSQVTVASVTSVLAAASSVAGGGAKRRRKRNVGLLSQNRTILQYWFNNSAGPPVTFAMDVSPLRILPPADFIRVPSGSFNAVLALDKPAENTVDITCSLDVIPRETQLHNTSELCSSSPTDKVAFTNSTVEIKLSKKDVQFQKDELFKTIDLTLTGSPAWRTESLVRVTCCGQDTGLSLRYANESAVAFTWVELRKLQPVDWSSITSGERKSTLVSDINLTCPCNLKENSCDAGCCCDQDCSDIENKSSTCIPGFFGGATSEKPFEFSCQASWPDSRDWQPFLCVTINNSPVIGYFYNVTSPPLAQDAISFNTLAEKKKREVFTFWKAKNGGQAFQVVCTQQARQLKLLRIVKM
ncbi:Tectonic-2 [Desmophyllum pertusum]|uniref:Tectonic-2 n=1 Tax=Desmophyllum pertusum TaxID=174260 RepID=A0A9W9ZU20_9CNID|nr:Tectonic-2 [Desmophyllum pertusum]